MSEITRPKDAQPLYLPPPSKALQIHLGACGSTKGAMDVEIAEKIPHLHLSFHHFKSLW
jgi:hypothetical protein